MESILAQSSISPKNAFVLHRSSTFYLALIALESTHLFDRGLFDINRLGQLDQIVSVLTQAWAVGAIAVITFTVQAIASDMAIRRRSSKLFICIWVSWLI
jgi:hypothetical protein